MVHNWYIRWEIILPVLTFTRWAVLHFWFGRKSGVVIYPLWGKSDPLSENFLKNLFKILINDLEIELNFTSNQSEIFFKIFKIFSNYSKNFIKIYFKFSINFIRD